MARDNKPGRVGIKKEMAIDATATWAKCLSLKHTQQLPGNASSFACKGGAPRHIGHVHRDRSLPVATQVCHSGGAFQCLGTLDLISNQTASPCHHHSPRCLYRNRPMLRRCRKAGAVGSKLPHFLPGLRRTQLGCACLFTTCLVACSSLGLGLSAGVVPRSSEVDFQGLTAPRPRPSLISTMLSAWEEAPPVLVF